MHSRFSQLFLLTSIVAFLVHPTAGAAAQGTSPDSLRLADSLGTASGMKAHTAQWYVGGIFLGTLTSASLVGTLITGGAGAVLAVPVVVVGSLMHSRAVRPDPRGASQRLLGMQASPEVREEFGRAYTKAAAPRRRGQLWVGTVAGILAGTYLLLQAMATT